MKRILIIFVASIFSLNFVFSQSCLPNGITFTTQGAIESFQINYPGCTIIEGDVEIKEDNISNLKGLSVLSSIEGSLSIIGVYAPNISLQSLSGLNNLISVGEDLSIMYSNSLVNLTGLNSLAYIGNDLTIKGTYNMTSLTGLANLTSIGAGIQGYKVMIFLYS